MFFKQIDLTTALRPILLSREILLFVQDGVGLYEGKYKIPNCQQGCAYLTSLRVCYVDQKEPRTNSVVLDLQEVDRVEYQAGFLKSSPKVTFHSKQSKRGHGSVQYAGSRKAAGASASSLPVSRADSPIAPSALAVRKPLSSATWICPICSFSNPVPPNFDPGDVRPSYELSPCQACGIKPPFSIVLKASVAAASGRGLAPNTDTQHSFTAEATSDPVDQTTQPTTTINCPRCTFLNDVSLPACELCGAPLTNSRSHMWRPESPGPRLAELDLKDNAELDEIKISFRAGGDRSFYERLNGALTQRKWLLQSAPPIPNPSPLPIRESLNDAISTTRGYISRPTSTPVGIAGLERRGLESRKNNEVVIGTAFEDLEALMASAKEIVALAERFAIDSGKGSSEASAVLTESAAALGMVTTRDKLDMGSENLYLSELSRNLAEYLTDDRKGVLRAEGGIMSLVDLWAIVNRSRNGVELVSPLDFYKAAQLWEELALPVRLRRFKSGLLAVQRADWNDEKTIRQLKTWFTELEQSAAKDGIFTEWSCFGRGVNAQEAAQRFGWSVGVASEELEMAEDKGVVCREEAIEGLRFWRNFLIQDARATDGQL